MNVKSRFRAKSINKHAIDFLTIYVLFRVLKRLEEEEGGGGGHVVTDFVTRVMQSSDWIFKNVPQDIGKVRLLFVQNT